jgi:hypothetical protein
VTVHHRRFLESWNSSPCNPSHLQSLVLRLGARRCLLLDTTDGLTKEETLWVALSAWATFEPRHKSRRQLPGTLYYPDEASHVFEHCWNHLGNLSAAPGFSDMSPIIQQSMHVFSQALGHYDCKSWETLPTADAPEKLAKIARDAAISRVRPIADGPNQWVMHRSSAHTDGPGSLSSSMSTESGAGAGSMGTCAGCSSPP